MSVGTTFFECSAIEAEIIKYMENSFLALKVAFVNQMYDVARASEADWETVREGWLLDPRIGRAHSVVFPEDRGFGGRCLPKDLDAIRAYAQGLGVDASILDAVALANRRLRGGDV